MGARDFFRSVLIPPAVEPSCPCQFVMFPGEMLSIAPQLNIDENLAEDLDLLQFPPEVEPVVSGASIC